MSKVLLIEASARRDASASRRVGTALAQRRAGAGGEVIHRDLAAGVPLIDEAFVTATFTPPEARNDADRAALAISDRLVDELLAADEVVIATPIYNFSVPGALKAWIDQIARVGRTFRYTAEGPVGLLEGKRAHIVVASGGTAIGSEVDFASGYLRHVLGFVGITDVTIHSAAELEPQLTGNAA